MKIVLGFGKYKKCTLNEVPTNYLKWLFTIVPVKSKLAIDVSAELHHRPVTDWHVDEDYDYDSEYERDFEYEDCDYGEHFFDS